MKVQHCHFLMNPWSSLHPPSQQTLISFQTGWVPAATWSQAKQSKFYTRMYSAGVCSFSQCFMRSLCMCIWGFIWRIRSVQVFFQIPLTQFSASATCYGDKPHQWEVKASKQRNEYAQLGQKQRIVTWSHKTDRCRLWRKQVSVQKHRQQLQLA